MGGITILLLRQCMLSDLFRDALPKVLRVLGKSLSLAPILQILCDITHSNSLVAEAPPPSDSLTAVLLSNLSAFVAHNSVTHLLFGYTITAAVTASSVGYITLPMI